MRLPSSIAEMSERELC